MTFRTEQALTADRVWLDEARAGGSAAFARLYDRHIKAVYWYSLRMLGSVEDAEDIAQDVFVLAWKKRSDVRIIDRSILPWLLVSARNLSLNKLKRSGRRAERHSLDGFQSDRADSARGPDAEAQGRMLLAAIQSAVDDLSLTDQTLYYLCIDEGFSYAQAATALGTSHGAVRNRLSRLRANLQLVLASQKEGLS